MTITLRGTHVVLRPLAIGDAAMTFAWRQGARASHLNRPPATISDQEQWIARRPTSEYNFIIERLDQRPVGMISLTNIDRAHLHAMPGRFLIGDATAVHGVPAAAEAMALVLALAFDKLGMHRIHGTIASDNGLMIKWQKHIGLREEGRLRDHYYIGGHYQDAVCMGLLVDEYRSLTAPRLAALVRMAGTPQH